MASDYIGVQMLSTQHRLTSDLSRRRRDGASSRGRRRASEHRRLRRAASRRAGRRPGRRIAARLHREPGPANEVPTGAVRPPVRRPAVAGGARTPCRRRSPGRAQISPDARWCSLENDGILPLAPDLRRVAVIGPIADSARELLGDYAHLLHIETLREMRGREQRVWLRADGRARRRMTSSPGARPSWTRSRPAFPGWTCATPGGRGSTRAPTTRSPRPSSSRRVVRGRHRGPRRAIRADRRRDHRRVPRPPATSGSWAASRSCSRRSSPPARPSSWSWSAAGRSRSSGPPSTAPRSCWPGCPARLDPTRSPRTLTGAGQSGRQAADHDPAARRPGPAVLSASPDRRAIEPEGRLRRRSDGAALAVRVRAVVHRVRAVEPPSRSHGDRDRGAAKWWSASSRRTSAIAPVTRWSSCMPATRRRASRGRSSSSAASGGSVSRPGSGEPCRSGLAAEQFAYTGADYRRVDRAGRITPVRRDVVGRPAACGRRSS